MTTQPKFSLINCANGGIGNQLFQHVFARSLAARMGVPLITDVSFYEGDPYGNGFALDAFDPELQTGRLPDYVPLGLGKLEEARMRSIHDVPRVPDNLRYVALDGYWQKELMHDAAEVDRAHQGLLASKGQWLKEGVGLAIVNEPNAVALHVRRKDYGHMGLCEDHYYLGALTALKLQYPDIKVFAFSDESNFVRHMLRRVKIDHEVVSTGDDVADLLLMSACRHFVIANSTFSWWGARFGEGKGGRVICPKEWVAVEQFPSPCPPRWIAVEGAVHRATPDLEACARVRTQILSQSAAVA